MTRSLPLGRITVGLAMLAVITAAALAGQKAAATRSGPAASDGVRSVSVARSSAPAAALERCRLSGPASADDPACRAAWAEARESFFARPLPEPSDD